MVHMLPRRDPTVLADLKRRIHGLETAGGQGGVLPTGLESIDRHLPGGGLARVAVHEVVAGPGPGAGFVALLAARRAGPVLWIARESALYGPGLARFGLDPERLILVRAPREAEVAWALEEGLRTPGLAAVVGELRALDLTAARRLQLAAEAGGGLGFVLRPDDIDRAGAGAAWSRWRVAPAASARTWTCWHLVLERCRGAAAADWIVEWNDATRDLALAAPADHRPAAPPQSWTQPGPQPARPRAVA